MDKRNPTDEPISRRGFLVAGSGALLSLAGLGAGCATSRHGPGTPAFGNEAWPIPFLEVSGSPYDCGLAIGKRFASRIQKGLDRRKAWFEPLRAFMQQDMANRCDGFLGAAQAHFPELVSELKGWSDGSGVAFHDLLALNLKAELGAMMAGQKTECPGCSTLALAEGERRLLAHNEDGDKAYADLMFLVKVRVPGQPAFLCLSYPGILPGNGPAMNEAGIVLTTNYIASTGFRVGVPRYFLDRAVLTARSLDEAVRIACHPERAFAFHFNLASTVEKRILSVETAVDRFQVHEVKGLVHHTNHLVLDTMRDVPQDEQYVNSSSTSRYKVLDAWRKTVSKQLERVDGPAMVGALSSHDKAPYSPCRHPDGEVSGATLATSLFDIGAGTWTLYPGNPCLAKASKLPTV